MTLDLLRKEILWPVLLFLSLSFFWTTIGSLASFLLKGKSIRTAEIRIQKHSAIAPDRSPLPFGGET